MIELDEIPAQRGIYQITDGRVSYVGLSDNIRSRLKQHLDSHSSRSRIILDTGKAKVIILELLPNASDRELALREWYWFETLKQRGHVMVNDPKALGKTKSGQYFPDDDEIAISRYSWLRYWLGLGTQAAAYLGVGVLFFWLGFIAFLGQDGSFPFKRSQGREIIFVPDCSTPLKPGSSGESVETLQTQLSRLGYYPYPVDGIYGDRTQRAVAALQRDRGLITDGIVGCNTQTAIHEALGIKND